jgi:hypothetical protein
MGPEPGSPFAPASVTMGAVRRSFAGLFFGAAFVCACLALSGFLLNRALFSPAASRDATAAIMSDTTIREEVVRLVSERTAEQLGGPSAWLPQVAASKAGARLLADVFGEIHGRIIGTNEADVIITSQLMVELVRDERAAAATPIIIPDLEEVKALSVTRDVVGWVVPLASIGIAVFLVLCFLARPERAALVRTLGLGLVVLAALVGVFGYVVPRFLPTALSDSVWVRVPMRLADDGATFVVVVSLVLAAAGLALFAGSARMGRGRRWSTPISTYRYREERRWS